MVTYLKLTYGKIQVISGGLLRELEQRKNPNDHDLKELTESLLAIMNVILRLQNLKTKLPTEQVLGKITSYNFLLRI